MASESASASITVHRPAKGFSDMKRAYKIEVDGQPHGKIKRGERRQVQLPPGPHRVQLRIDWATSEPIELELAPGEHAHLGAYCRNPLQAIYYVTAGRRRYIDLRRLAGPPIT